LVVWIEHAAGRSREPSALGIPTHVLECGGSGLDCATAWCRAHLVQIGGWLYLIAGFPAFAVLRKRRERATADGGRH
jgi:hypothetical protein